MLIGALQSCCHLCPFPALRATAERAIEEYKRMLTLVQRFPDAPVVPSKLVDIVWCGHFAFLGGGGNLLQLDLCHLARAV